MMPGRLSKGQRVWLGGISATVVRVDLERWVDTDCCDLVLESGEFVPNVPGSELQVKPISPNREVVG